jgi:hypothetical protein
MPMPGGRTSNHLHTRDALLDAVTDRFVVREQALWEQLALRRYPTTAGFRLAATGDANRSPLRRASPRIVALPFRSAECPLVEVSG